MRLYKQQYLILIIIDLDWRMVFSVYPFYTHILRARSAMYKWTSSRIFHAATRRGLGVLLTNYYCQWHQS